MMPANIRSLLKRLITASVVRIPLLFLFHAGVFAFCYIFAWLVRFEFEVPSTHEQLMISSAPFIVGFQLFIGALFGFYRGWWRYVGISDVTRIVAGMTAALAVLVGVWYVGDSFGLDDTFSKPPRGVLLIDWAFALLALFGARVAVRLSRDRNRAESTSVRRRIVVIGAGDAGETLAREIQHRPQLGLVIAAFVDDHRAKWGSSIRGIPVRGPISEIATIAEEVRADEALLAIPSASGKRLREIIHHLAEARLEFKTIPGIDQMVSGKVHISQIRPVKIEDLIRRERIQLPGDRVHESFSGKRVLITGAGGTIGSELAEQILDLDPEALHLVERSEYALYQVDQRLSRQRPWLMNKVQRHLADIRDLPTMDTLLEAYQPHIVLHAAAHKHVPLGEENPREYLQNNALATRALAEICERRLVERFVLISTDKAIRPTSVMGATKRVAEILLMDLARSCTMKISAVRFGNVLGSSGSVVPLFMEQIAAGGPITVTHPDVTRYFLRTSEAISLVLQAATLGQTCHGCVFMLDMGEPRKIADLARDLIELSGRDDIEISFTGLRQGEKLFEEVRLEGESIEPTEHPQIVITRAPQPSSSAVAEYLQQLGMCEPSPVAIINTLREIVPDYLPNRDASAPPGETSVGAPLTGP